MLCKAMDTVILRLQCSAGGTIPVDYGGELTASLNDSAKGLAEGASVLGVDCRRIWELKMSVTPVLARRSNAPGAGCDCCERKKGRDKAR